MKLGVNVAVLREEFIQPIIESKADSILLAFHLAYPKKELLKQLIDKGVSISARYISSKREQQGDMKPKFREMISEYADYIDRWSLGGEPDMPSSHPTSCRWWGSPEEYAQALRSFYEIAKELDPTASVEAGSFISGSHYGLRDWDLTPFLHRLFRYDTLDFLDTISVVLWSRHHGGISHYYASYHCIQSILNLYGINRPLSIYEFGLPEVRGEKGNVYTPEDQASELLKDYVIFRQLGYQEAYYYKLECGRESQDYYGLLDEKNQPKANFEMFRRIQMELGDAKFVCRSSRIVCDIDWKSDYVYCYIFEKGDKWLNIIWHNLENPIRYKDIMIDRHPQIVYTGKGEVL